MVYSNYFKQDKIVNYDCIEPRDRDNAVLRLIELFKQKGYRPETLHLAITLLDRVLALSFQYVKREHLILYVVTCLIMGAKMEQPLTPSINLMIGLLTPHEKEIVTKNNVLILEDRILNLLHFNLLFMNPYQFLERYLRLSELHENADIVKASKEILLLSRTKTALLDYKPS